VLVKIFFKLIDHRRVVILFKLSLNHLCLYFTPHFALESRIHANVIVILTLFKRVVSVTLSRIHRLHVRVGKIAYEDLGEVMCPHLDLRNGRPHRLIRQQHFLETNIQELRVQRYYLVKSLYRR